MNKARELWVDIITRRASMIYLISSSVLILILVLWIATLEKEVSELRINKADKKQVESIIKRLDVLTGDVEIKTREK